MTIHALEAKDGTRLVYRRSGDGPPLVIVHGTSSSAADWLHLFPALESHFSLHVLDRRGCGDSGDAPVISFERQLEDVVSLIDSIGQPAHLLGHSFGAICALEAALLTPRIKKLILYEPPALGVPNFSEEAVERFEALIAAGDRDAVLTTFYLEIVSRDEVEAWRASPDWTTWVARADVVTRELRALLDYRFHAERFSDLNTPTLMLTGSNSPAYFTEGTNAVAAALPNCQVVVMPGQSHAATTSAPDLFVREVITFLEA